MPASASRRCSMRADSKLLREPVARCRSEALARDSDRKRMGAYLCAIAVGALCWQLDLPWWHTALIVGAIYVGIHMAAGISFF
jgi:hypothetical protein